MTIQPSPILLSWNMFQNAKITTFRAVSDKDKNPFNWRKSHPLPNALSISTDYNPPRLHLLTNNSIETSNEGWSCDGSWEWNDAPIKAKRRIFQSLIKKHLKSKNKQQLGSQWVIEGPKEVESEDGSKSTIWICADFQYIEIDGEDGIGVEIRRKVQSSNSIWEEMEQQIYDLNSQNKDVRVKVKDASDSGKMQGKKLIKITQDNLNSHAWNGSEMTLAEYWNQDRQIYSAKNAEAIPVVLVNRYPGDEPSRYPADKVYRVMSMDNWSQEVRKELEPYLNLKPSKYLDLVKIAMRWFNGWKINDNSIKINFGWQSDYNVKFSDSRKILKLPNDQNMLNNYWRWSHNLVDFNNLHSKPLPSIDVHYAIPSGLEIHHNDLKSHASNIFSQIPEWSDRVQHLDLHIIPNTSQAEVDLYLEDMIEKINKTNRRVVVFSALPSKGSKSKINFYKTLKYALDESNIAHQNFAIRNSHSLNKKPDSASAKVNVLQMLLKLGFLPVPYKCSIGDVDIVSALDVGRIGPNESVTAFAVSITKTGQLWGTTPKGEPQTGETISEDAIRRTIKSIIKRNRKENDCLPQRILVMRDGNTPNKELHRVQKIISEYREIGVDICWLSVRKSGAPRLLNFENNKVVEELPEKGHWMQYGKRSAWIWSTGSPELKSGRPGIPQGSSFTIEVNFENNPLSLESTSQLLIAHAHASQSQPWNSTRLPFVHHLADAMAKAMANGEIPLDQNGTGFSAA